MKIVGIIVEYNPFHNGHLYHIEQVRKISKCDILVCVISGNYVMRGNVSILDKYAKTEIALQYGVDLIVEIPFYFVNNSSDIFSFGAISILKKLKVTDIYFGSECNNIDLLYSAYVKTNSTLFQSKLKAYLKEGLSFSSSYQKALDLNIKSNDLLGIDYIRANETLKASINLHTIKRVDSNYNDSYIENTNIQSATFLRTLDDLGSYVPKEVKELVNGEKRDIKNLFHLINHQLTILSKTEIKEILNISEGLENSFKKCLNLSYDEFINKLISKRYNINKINRILLNLLVNFKKTDFIKEEPNFIIVLGFNNLGKMVLNKIKKDVIIYTKLNNGINKIIDLQIKADTIYNHYYTSKRNHLILKKV